MSAAVTGHGHHHWDWGDLSWLRSFLVKASVVTAAIIVLGAKLNQQAVIATNDFPRIYRGKSRSHRVVGVPEQATPGTNFGGEVPTARSICGNHPVDVKIKIYTNSKSSGCETPLYCEKLK